MIRNCQYKLYPNQSQIKTLERWLGTCCWVYNQALEMRIKGYKRRGKTITYNYQQAWLGAIRKRIQSIKECPSCFERDALRRLDRGMCSFFRRCKAGKAPGFPRFRSRKRYNSMEYLAPATYLRDGRFLIPKLGEIRCRGPLVLPGTQKGFLLTRKATGWYVRVIIDTGVPKKPSDFTDGMTAVGVDVGLKVFATFSNGENVANPRFYQASQAKGRGLHRRVSRRKKGSNRYAKAVIAMARHHEKTAGQRSSFCHQVSTALVRKYDLIGVEKLNVAGMKRSRFGKAISDVSWATFTKMLVVKAEDAGRRVIFVNARYTSQTCPNCGNVKPKKISERTHSCSCGLVCDRDHAAARVILARALELAGATRQRRDLADESVPFALI